MMSIVLLLACADSKVVPTPRDTSDDATGLSIVSLAPGSGPASGGTPVIVGGSGFTAQTVASVGGSACASLSFVSPRELTCVTPPGTAGDATLVVIDGAETASARFTYVGEGETDTALDTARDTADTTNDTAPDTSDTAPPDTGGTDSGATDSGSDTSLDTAAPGPLVDYCHLQWPCTMTKAPGATSDAVYAWVYQGDRTRGVGAGVGVRVEVGVGPNGSDPLRDVGWTWYAATYNADKDGLTPGDRANDEYVGTFLAPSRGPWDYCMRVSLDDGRSWRACDAGGSSCVGSGSDDGYRPDDAGQLTVR